MPVAVGTVVPLRPDRRRVAMLPNESSSRGSPERLLCLVIPGVGQRCRTGRPGGSSRWPTGTPIGIAVSIVGVLKSGWSSTKWGSRPSMPRRMMPRAPAMTGGLSAVSVTSGTSVLESSPSRRTGCVEEAKDRSLRGPLPRIGSEHPACCGTVTSLLTAGSVVLDRGRAVRVVAPRPVGPRHLRPPAPVPPVAAPPPGAAHHVESRIDGGATDHANRVSPHRRHRAQKPGPPVRRSSG